MVKEKELEDYIERHLEVFDRQSETVVLGRQVPLVHGIADLIIGGTDGIYIVELKAVHPKPEDVCQVLRYTYDVRDIKDYVFNKFSGTQRETDRILWFCNNPLSVKPVLVASGSDENITAAMHACSGIYYEWSLDDGGFSLQEHFPSWDRSMSIYHRLIKFALEEK
jgi:hypothetical protein